MHRVHAGPTSGFAGLLAMLVVLDVTTELTVTAWLAGLGCGAGVALLLDAALRRHGAVPGPADMVTLARAQLACAVAALAIAAHATAVLVVLATVALVLDGVDGWLARRTGTVSALGARFDLEVDAFLILVLSAYVAPAAGWWVLLIGAARYLFVLAGRVLPWLHGTIPPRPWCKVVAVAQGVVLTVAAAGVLPLMWERLALVVALALLAESFGREVRDLWRVRVPAPQRVVALVGRG